MPNGKPAGAPGATPNSLPCAKRPPSRRAGPRTRTFASPRGAARGGAKSAAKARPRQTGSDAGRVADASPDELQTEVARLTKALQRARTEIKNLKLDVQHAYRMKGGRPLPEKIAKMVAQLGDPNENRRMTALGFVERALKEAGLNWSDVANRLK